MGFGQHRPQFGITTEKRAYSPFYKSLKSVDVDKKVKRLLRIKLLHEVAHLWGAKDERAEHFAETFSKILKFTDSQKVKCITNGDEKICVGDHVKFDDTKYSQYRNNLYSVLEIFNNGTAVIKVLSEPYLGNESSAPVMMVASKKIKTGVNCLNLRQLDNDELPAIKICKNQLFSASNVSPLLQRCSVSELKNY